MAAKKKSKRGGAVHIGVVIAKVMRDAERAYLRRLIADCEKRARSGTVTAAQHKAAMRELRKLTGKLARLRD